MNRSMYVVLEPGETFKSVSESQIASTVLNAWGLYLGYVNLNMVCTNLLRKDKDYQKAIKNGVRCRKLTLKLTRETVEQP